MRLGEAFVALGFDVDDSTLKSFNDKIDQLEVSMFKMSGVTAAALYGVDKFIDSVSRGAIALRDMSIQTGLSQQDLQAWSVAAHLSDTAFSTENAQSSIAALQTSIAKLNTGEGNASAFSKLLGVDARNMTAFQVLDQLHARMPMLLNNPIFGGRAGISNVMQQAGIDPHFLNLLMQTDEQYQKTRKSAEAYMMTISQNKNLVAMDFAAEQLRMRLEMLEKTLGATFAPKLIEIMEKIPQIVDNIARGAEKAKLPLEALGVVIAAIMLSISPWMAIAAAIGAVLTILEELGDEADDNSFLKQMENSVKEIGDAINNYLIQPLKDVMQLISDVSSSKISPQVDKDSVDMTEFNKTMEMGAPGFTKDESGQITGRDWDRLFAEMDSFQDTLMQAAAPPLAGVTNQNANVNATYNIHTSNAKEGLDAADDHHAKQIRQAYDNLNNGGQ